MPNQRTQDEIELRRYLLGWVAAEECPLIEERLLRDRRYFADLLRLEEELIDEYAGNSMAAPDRGMFERYFLNSPERFEKLEFARAFNRSLCVQASGRPTDVSIRRSPIASTAQRLSFLRARWVIAASIILLFAAGFVWLLVKGGRLQRQLDSLRVLVSEHEEQERELIRKLDLQRARDDAMAAEITQLREGSMRPDKGPIADSSLRTVMLTLTPGLNRGQSSTVDTAILSPSARHLRLELLLDNADHPNYYAEVQTVEGQIVWHGGHLKPRHVGVGKEAVTVSLPVSLLAHSDYVLMLAPDAGKRPAQTTSPAIGSHLTYYLRIVRK